MTTRRWYCLTGVCCQRTMEYCVCAARHHAHLLDNLPCIRTYSGPSRTSHLTLASTLRWVENWEDRETSTSNHVHIFKMKIFTHTHFQAVDELFRMMKLMTQKLEGCTEEEVKAIAVFRRTTLQMYLSSLDARSSWQTLIMWVSTCLKLHKNYILIFVLFPLSIPIYRKIKIILHVQGTEAFNGEYGWSNTSLMSWRITYDVWSEYT